MKFNNPLVEEKFYQYPASVRNHLLCLRQMIFEVAGSIKGVGKIEETLKWNEPSYLTIETKSGTTIRIDWKAKEPNQYAMYFNCKTTLVETFRQLFPHFSYEGNRAISFKIEEMYSKDDLSECIAMALTYHMRL